jgi:hypothetical protein
MDELVDRIVAKIGIDRPVAERAVGIILDFLATEGPTERVDMMLARLPGAAAAIAAARASGEAGGGGIMGVGMRLMSAGLGMGEIRGVTHEIISFSRENVGSADTDAIVAQIPGLDQFI